MRFRDIQDDNLCVQPGNPITSGMQNQLEERHSHLDITTVSDGGFLNCIKHYGKSGCGEQAWREIKGGTAQKRIFLNRGKPRRNFISPSTQLKFLALKKPVR